jgi:hypothetical protein
VNPYALKPCLFSESLIGFTISNSSSITNIDRMSSSNRNERSYVDSNIVIEIAVYFSIHRKDLSLIQPI